ncbi:MAG: hypothetical protein WCN88_02425 [Candidatus Falkowbacteria bacterium]
MKQIRLLVILFTTLGTALLFGAAGLLFQKMVLSMPKIDYISVASFGITGVFFLIVAIVTKRQIVA